MTMDKNKGNVYRPSGLNVKLNLMKKNKSSSRPIPNVTTSYDVTPTPKPNVTISPVVTPAHVATHTSIVIHAQDFTTSRDVIVIEDVTPTRDEVIPMQLDVTPAQGATHAQYAESTTEQGSSSKRRRVSNKKIVLTKLTGNREKVLVVFNLVNGKPVCNNRKTWTRHLRRVVRDNFVVKHRTLKWKFLVQSELDNLWQHVIDKFDAINIANYRDATLLHMQQLWNRWRTDMKRYHIDVHEGDMNKITNDKPKEVNREDWQWLLKNHFFTDQFQKTSATNKNNRKKHKYVQVAREMKARDKKYSSYEDVFAETHKKKGESLDTDAQSKYDKMHEVSEKNPSISNMDMGHIAEEVFDLQNNGNVIGMGTEVVSSQFSDDESWQALYEENVYLRNALKQLKEDHQSIQNYMKSLNEMLDAMEERRIAVRAADDLKRLDVVDERMIVERAVDDLKRLEERIEVEKRLEAMMMRCLLVPTSTLTPPPTSKLSPITIPPSTLESPSSNLAP